MAMMPNRPEDEEEDEPMASRALPNPSVPSPHAEGEEANEGEENDPDAFAEDEENAEEEGSEGESSGVTPEEQEMYTRFIGRAMELIYDEKMFPKVVDMLDGDGQEPATGLALATAMVVTRVARAAEEGGITLSPDVLYHGGVEVLEQLAEVSDEAKISNYAQDKDSLESAFWKAIDIVLKQLTESGDLDPNSAKQAMQQLQEMDASGELEQKLRGLAEKDGQSAPAPKPKEADPMKRGGMVPSEEGAM